MANQTLITKSLIFFTARASSTNYNIIETDYDSYAIVYSCNNIAFMKSGKFFCENFLDKSTSYTAMDKLFTFTKEVLSKPVSWKILSAKISELCKSELLAHSAPFL